MAPPFRQLAHRVRKRCLEPLTGRYKNQSSRNTTFAAASRLCISKLDEVDVPHQLLFVCAADGNLHFPHFHRVLESVNVLDALEIHNEVP